VKKPVSVIVLLLALSFAFVSFPEIGVVKADDTIYIRADGTVEGTGNILRDGNVYTFTDNIYDLIAVERDNVVVDGAGYTLQGAYNDTQVGPWVSGIMMYGRSNVTIKNIKIKSFHCGLYLNSSSGNNISGNTITSEIGILLTSSHNNTVSGNIITKTRSGISLEGGMMVGSKHNIISGNYIINNRWEGIFIQGSSNQIIGNYIANNGNGTHIVSPPFGAASSNNLFYHNSFVNNTRQIYIEKGFAIPDSINVWDNGYPSGGNYWSDYYFLNDNDGDGIGDVAYAIDVNNLDYYPIMSSPMSPLSIFDAGTWEWTNYNVYVISNSTVSDFSFNPEEDALIRFNVEGETGTTGFCNVTIPKNLLHTENNWIVLVDDNPVTPAVNEDTSNTRLYFTYNQGSKTVEIIGTTAIPEFPSWTPLLGIIMLTAAVALCRLTRGKSRKS